MTAIKSSFNISPWLFLVPIAVIAMIIKKIPALPALLVGTLLGGVFAVIFQPHIITQISGIEGNVIKASYVAIINAMGGEISITTSNVMINDLLSTGGMYGMLNTIWLILCAMMFGGVMEATVYSTESVHLSYSMQKVPDQSLLLQPAPVYFSM